MSLCAIIPTSLMLAANDALEQAGYGALNFSVPLYGATGATYAGLHTWGDLPFESAIKAIAGVVWEESNGEPYARFQALVESQGAKWGAIAPPIPRSGIVPAGALYRETDDTLWLTLVTYDIGVFPDKTPSIIRQQREPFKVYPWTQPTDQFDSYKLLNPFTNQNDECTFEGKTYYVTAADGAGNNVWPPAGQGSFGWSETDPTPNILVRAWDAVLGWIFR